MAVDVQLSSNSPTADAGFRNAKLRTTGSNPVFASFEFPNIGGVDPQSGTSYTTAASDEGKLIDLTNSSAVAVTLDSTLPNYFLCAVRFEGAAGGTLTPSSGTINGSASLTLTQGQSCWLFFNGTNWWALSLSSTGSVTNTSGALTNNYPVFGNGGSDIKTEQPRGNTTVVQLADSITNPTSGDLAVFDANGNIKDGGAKLTTKGDLLTYGSALARLGVGTDGQGLVADSTQTLGIKWGSLGAAGGGTQFGAIGSLPGSPGAAGNTYICSDAPYTFVSDGSNWNAIFMGYPVTRPILGNFSWVAQGSATASQSNGTIVLMRPSGAGGDQLSSLVVTPPSTPYTYTLGFRPFLLYTNYFQAGIILRKSSTGKCVVLSWFGDTAKDSEIQVVEYTQPSSGTATFNATRYSSIDIVPRDLIFLRVNNDGTNLNCSIGINPWFFLPTAYAEPLSTWISSVDQVGFFADANTVSTSDAVLDAFHWIQT